MCGFAGILNSKAQLHKKEVEAIASCVSFRGPDHTNVHVLDQAFTKAESGNTAFFFNRLSILDLDPRSNQPFEDERYTLLFNGEIYNFQSLRRELEALGHRFTTTSDTEVLFKGLIAWQESILPKLNGMFSFFFFDRKERSFLIARDRMGIKPLYYSISEGSLAFGSELHSVVRLQGKNFSVSDEAIGNYLWLQYIPAPQTALRSVLKLPPGNFLKGTLNDLGNNKPVDCVAYWDAYDVPMDASISEGSALERLESLLRKSVESQLQADVPLGFFLSSGVDSSLLAAIANKYFSGKTFSFFTVAFDEKTLSDESRDANRFLSSLKNDNLKHITLSVNPASVSSLLPSLYSYIDEPFGDSTVLLNWLIALKAKEHVTVVLSGDGADELFYGYPRYLQWQRRVSSLTNKSPLAEIFKWMPGLLPDSKLKYRLAERFEKDELKTYFNLIRPALHGFLNNPADKKQLWFSKSLEQISNRRDLPQMVDLKTYLPDGMLYKVDRSSMAASLEARVPYLDNEVIDFALSLPLSLKSSDIPLKALPKKVLNAIAPQYGLHQNKKGFNFPLEKWMRGDWKEQICDLYTKDNLLELKLDPDRFLPILDRFYRRNASAANEVWYVFNLILWKKTFERIIRSGKNEKIPGHHH